MDSKGRVVLPQEVRDRIGFTPGTEVDVSEEDGNAVVEPEDDPEQITERIEQLVDETSSRREETPPLDDGVDLTAQTHRDAVRRGAATSSEE